MPLDAFCISGVVSELTRLFIGSKIDKVSQPERDILILSMRGSQVSARLLLSAGVNDARTHVTNAAFDNPMSPPMFCMLLRKHLTGAVITKIVQPECERSAEFVIRSFGMLGEPEEKRLIVEMAGRHSNIILTDSEGVIIDCLRRVGGELSDKRQVLPGLIYRGIPAQKKSNPFMLSEDAWRLQFANAADVSCDKRLLNTFMGVSPAICREIVWRAYGHTDIQVSRALELDGGESLCREFFDLIRNVQNSKFSPSALRDDNGELVDFSYIPLLQFEGKYIPERAESFSVLLDEWYTEKEQKRRWIQKCSDLTKLVKNARGRIARKLDAQRLELEKTADRDYYRECGDIITANIYALKKGEKCLTAPDFFSEPEAVRQIKLDPQKTPQQNAAKYYKEYTKLKTAEKYLTEQIQIGSRELEYLESVLEELTRANSDAEISEIRKELVLSGYLREQRSVKGKKPKTRILDFLRFESSEGFEIRAGRNNIQNDELTLKRASKGDIWLHVSKQHGTHVIITVKDKSPGPKTLEEAATIAAVYSKAGENNKTSVDYCLVKYVKKPNGAKPGMVIYSEYKTLTVRPNRTVTDKLAQKRMS